MKAPWQAISADEEKERTVKSIAAKQNRIDVRLPHGVYEILCRAADLSGMVVNRFLVQSALKAAQVVIEREAVIHLSSRDWNWLLDLTDASPKPNEQLQAALNRYKL